MEFITHQIRQRLDEKWESLNNLRPLDPALVAKLRTQMEIEMTYHSNAIEGNSLTLRETLLVLQEGITIKGKSLKDHLEAKDHWDALEFLFELVSGDMNATISEHVIRQLHQLVIRETEREHAGKYRTGVVMIAGSSHMPPEAADISRQMERLIHWFHAQEKILHPIELAALVHHKLLHIHPFFDGNGRTARLVMNIILMRSGFPLAIILKNDRKKYYLALQHADRGNPAALTLFIAQAVERSLDIYLRTFAKNQSGTWLTLSQASVGSPYSTKYLNLLARTGRIGAHKRGRVWFTTKEAIQKYRENRMRKR